MNSTPNWKLRRLAARALRILLRRAKHDPVIAAYLTTLKPHAEAMIKAYDEAGRYRADWLREMMEGRGAVAELLRQLRSWLPLFVRDVPGFDGSSFGDSPVVPDDVLEDAGRLIDTAADFEANTGQVLPYIELFNDTFGKALEKAVKEWSEAEASDKQHQDVLARVRESGELLAADLKAFRRTMQVVAGRSDADYQKLRVTRAHIKDEDDDADAPEAPGPVTPAEPDAGTPVAPTDTETDQPVA